MKMNKYETPEITVVTLATDDVITTSQGDTPTISWEW